MSAEPLPQDTTAAPVPAATPAKPSRAKAAEVEQAAAPIVADVEAVAEAPLNAVVDVAEEAVKAAEAAVDAPVELVKLVYHAGSFSVGLASGRFVSFVDGVATVPAHIAAELRAALKLS